MHLFDNRVIGKCVCIDWDIFFEDFIKKAIPSTISLVREIPTLPCVRDYITLNDIKAYYQASASNNVHIALRFPVDLTVLDGFMIRAWLGDDETRLRLDLARYAKTASLHEMNRCFESKITFTNGQGTLSKAGEWIRLDLFMQSFEDDNYPMPTSSEAHTQISLMQEECLRVKRDKKRKEKEQERIDSTAKLFMRSEAD